MNIIVPKKSILPLLEDAARIASQKATAGTDMAMTLLRAARATSGEAPGRVEVVASDHTRSLVGHVEAEVGAAGEATAPAKSLALRVKAMPDGPVEIDFVDGQATVRAVGAPRRFSLYGMAPETYPPIPQPSGETRVLRASELIDVLARTKHSISTDETRPHINSAFVEWEGQVMRVTTTDGHRLSTASLKRGPRPGVPLASATTTMLIPSLGVADILTLCEAADPQAEVRVREGGSNLFVELGERRFSVRLAEGRFPPAAAILGSSYDHTATLPRAPFLDTIRAVLVACDTKTSGLRLAFSRGRVEVMASSVETGSGCDEMVVSYDGPDITVGVAGKYVADALLAMTPPVGEPDDIALSFSREIDPICIRPTWKSDDLTMACVIMPMRL